MQEWPRNIAYRKYNETIRCAYNFMILEVHVPVRFSGTEGFSATQGWTVIQSTNLRLNFVRVVAIAPGHFKRSPPKVILLL